MPKEELKEYITIVYEMESSIYEQETIIQKIEGKIEKLGKIAKPVKPKKNINKEIFKIVAEEIKDSLALLFYSFALGIFFMLIGGICSDLFPNFAEIIAFIGLGLWAIGIIGVIYGIFSAIKKGKKSIDSFNSSIDNYNKMERDYNVQLEKEQLEKSRLQMMLPSIQQGMYQSKALLNEIYSCNIIYPKYRNLIAVSSFYDYLMSGRCYSLEATAFGGSDGAYNIYEQEARLDRIITQLDTVIACLNQIKSNQYMLYKAITNSNKKVDQLCDSLFSTNQALTDINQNMTLLNYNSELTRKELEYQNRMNRIYHVWG